MIVRAPLEVPPPLPWLARHGPSAMLHVVAATQAVSADASAPLVERSPAAAAAKGPAGGGALTPDRHRRRRMQRPAPYRTCPNLEPHRHQAVGVSDRPADAARARAQVAGHIFDEQGRKVYALRGAWNSHLTMVKCDAGGEPLPDAPVVELWKARAAQRAAPTQGFGRASRKRQRTRVLGVLRTCSSVAGGISRGRSPQGRVQAEACGSALA